MKVNGVFEVKILIVHKNQARACNMARNILVSLESKGIEANTLPVYELTTRFWQDYEMVIVLGGDGTILETARLLSGTDIPLLGVNMGKIGFLSSINPEVWPLTRDKLLQHQYYVEKRMMIDIAVVRDEQECYRGLALNDAVIRSRVLHTISVNLLVNHQPYASFQGDGVICATPTGSTAYSYSAGGPVLYQQMEALAITPVCPQLSCARAMVVPASLLLEFIVVSCYGALITLDGRDEVDLLKGDRVLINKSAQTTNFVQIEQESSMKKIMQCRNKVTDERNRLVMP